MHGGQERIAEGKVGWPLCVKDTISVNHRVSDGVEEVHAEAGRVPGKSRQNAGLRSKSPNSSEFGDLLLR